MSDKLPETSNSSEEVDLVQLFKLIGKAFERFYNFIGSVLNKLFLSFVWLVFFFKKHFFKILIAGFIGYGISFVKGKISGPVFVSSVTVKQNYNTGENLYDMVNYYNSAVKVEGSAVIVNTLGVDLPSETNIISLEIEPLISENHRIQDYDNFRNGLDSSLAANVDYETYLDNTMNHDYKRQKISIKTKESRNLLSVFEGIINKAGTSEFFKVRQKRDLEELTNRELAIKQSLIESDSLKNTYKRVLEKTTEKGNESPQTSITIEGKDNVNKTKEFELYRNDLVLRRELVGIEREKQNKEKIIEIISSEFTSGTADSSIEIFNIRASERTLYFILFSILCFVFLIGLEFLKYLEKFKK